jgi:hypothetical protein
MILIVHGGQTGVDRGAHEAALNNGWLIAGYMPRDGRDELGKIPEGVARFLAPHDKPGLAARTEANVRAAAAALIIVRDMNDPRVTPGTAKTIDLAATRRLPRLIVDPTTDTMQIAHWIWNSQRVFGTLFLPLMAPPGDSLGSIPTRLLVAGPRESKWPGARAETTALLHRVADALTALPRAAKT